MKINNLGYLCKEGIRGIFLHGFMSFAAVCVTVACLLIIGVFSSLLYNVNVMVEKLNKTNEIMVYVDESLSDADAKSIGTRINLIENVLNSKFVSREQALVDFIADHEEEADSFSGVVAQDLRHRFVVTLQDNRLMEETVDQIQAITGVAKINAEYEIAEGFAALQDMLRILTIAVIGVLLVVSLLIISNTVKLAMYDRKDEIAIMKMVGATNGFIRLPYVVEGFTLGMIGAAVAFALQWVLYDMMLGRIENMDALPMLDMVPFSQLLGPMIAIFVGAGLFVGVVGSWTSIRKFLDV